MQSEDKVGQVTVTRRVNYVLIDHENVQPSDMALLDREDVRLWVFVGASQPRMSSELTIQMLAMRERPTCMRISGNGPNALDFHIAFYIGQLAQEDPRGFFHIISKDTGFDPLVTHLKSKQIFACRSAGIAQIPLFKPQLAALPRPSISVSAESTVVTSLPQTAAIPPAVAAPGKPALTAAEKITKVQETLGKMAKARPTKLTSLKNHVSAQFQKSISSDEIDALITGLQNAGVLKVANGKVSYG